MTVAKGLHAPAPAAVPKSLLACGCAGLRLQKQMGYNHQSNHVGAAAVVCCTPCLWLAGTVSFSRLTIIVHFASHRPVNNSREHYRFQFDGILLPDAKQDEVFERTAHPLVAAALDGCVEVQGGLMGRLAMGMCRKGALHFGE